ncbi:AraC family transcriptional regulator [Bacillus timonensis]|uniref:AraC family transcriptional regulator n=1 Tax=Bacillus timonensis TaxID=1033734 RepID=UPI000289DB55|nr:AraC family transcriptional regulator [Bacillus timonensis]
MKQLLHYETKTFALDHTVIESPYDIDTHIHDGYELYYYISGDLTYYIEGQAYELYPNDIIITNSRELHRIVFNSDVRYERKFIQFRPEYITSYQTEEYNLLNYIEHRKLGYFNKISAEYVLKSGINKLWEKIEEATLEDAPENQILMKTYFVQLLIKINKIFSEFHNPLIERHQYDYKIVSILDFINKNLDKKISLDLLQDTFFVNKYYLSHIFKRNTGFTIMEYITYKRIMWAMELLLSGITALDVAHRTGFSDYSTFYKAFKKITGISPRQYCSA